MHRGIHVVAVAVVVSTVGCPGDGGDDGASSGGMLTTSTASSTSSDPSATSSPASSGSGSGSATSSPADSGTTAAGGCDPPTNENPEYLCCDGAWVDPRSDLLNCGACGTVCEGETPFCDQGTCAAVPCMMPQCNGDQSCCGSECCDPGTICCTINGPIESGPGCVPPTESGSCPGGCAPLCQCAGPRTPVATPTGDRPIAELSAGDLVYSIDHGAITVVPIARVQRVRVQDHHVTQVELDDGRRLRVTPSHPLADGRAFSDVLVGEHLGDGLVVDVRTVPYEDDFTHDILPRSSTGAYFVAGAAVASTMRDIDLTRPADRGMDRAR